MARAPSRSPRQPRPSGKPGPRGRAKAPAPRKAPLRPAARRAAAPPAGRPDRCTEVLRKLQKFIENEFSPADRARIDAHLAACPDCRREYEAMRSLIETLDTTRIVSVPDSFRAAVMNRIRKS